MFLFFKKKKKDNKNKRLNRSMYHVQNSFPFKCLTAGSAHCLIFCVQNKSLSLYQLSSHTHTQKFLSQRFPRTLQSIKYDDQRTGKYEKIKPGQTNIYAPYKNNYTHFTITGFAANIRHVVLVFTLTAKCSSCSDSESKQKHRSHVRFLRKLHKYVKSINLLPFISFLVPASACTNRMLNLNAQKQQKTACY